MAPACALIPVAEPRSPAHSLTRPVPAKNTSHTPTLLSLHYHTMGTYLSQPVKDKETEDGAGANLRYAASAMQGWRRSMEDEHIAQTAVAPPPQSGANRVALFGVFDGHGGREVAKFAKLHMVEQLQSLETYRACRYEDALVELFHRIDDMLEQDMFQAEVQVRWWCHCGCCVAPRW